MEVFKKRNLENNEWWGYSQEYGWVVLDRNLYSNRKQTINSPKDKVVILKCSNWSSYEELNETWKKQNSPYIWAPNYLNKFKGVDLQRAEAEVSNLLQYYLEHKAEIGEKQAKEQSEWRFEKLSKLHNQYLSDLDLPQQTLIKIKPGFRNPNHCFKCNSTIDIKTGYECGGCGWIVCDTCGACEKPECGAAKH